MKQQLSTVFPHPCMKPWNQRTDPMSSLAQALSDDKRQVGALDSTCNRTCCGNLWMDAYIAELRRSAPSCFIDLISTVDEQERFRFGNGGTVTSAQRWRIPILLAELL